MISDALFFVLTNAPAITAIVGTSASRKDSTAGVFAGEMPPNTPNPSIVTRQISGDSDMTFDGPSGVQYVRFQFSCYGQYLQSKQLARAVNQALERFTGTCPDGTQIQNMQTVLEADTFQEAPYQYVTSIELEITYADPTF